MVPSNTVYISVRLTQQQPHNHCSHTLPLTAAFFTTTQAFGRIDCLVSNAAVSPAAAPISETPGHAIDKILDINVKSAALLVNVSGVAMVVDF